MGNVDKKIAKYIVLAQVASDSGKDLDYLKDLLGDKSNKAWREEYKGKDKYIMFALKLIAKNPDCNFRFSVVSGQDVSTHLVYFSFKLDGVRHQVSFHSFDKNLHQFRCSSKKTRWDHKSSRSNCVKLAQYYSLS